MSSFYFSRENLCANHIDFKRLSRNIRKEFNARNPEHPINNDQALELTARVLGASSHHDARRKAEDPDISSWPTQEIEKQLRDGTVAKGAKLPGKLPKQFDKDWQEKSEGLLHQAIEALQPGALEFIALVGQQGTGKTLLANALCHDLGGYVIDTDLALDKGTGHPYLPGNCLIYDRSVKPVSVIDEPDPFLFSKPGAYHGKRTLMNYRKFCKPYGTDIPHDDFMAFNRLRDWVRNNPDVRLVITFPDLETLETALQNAPRILPTIHNWSKVHEVDLNSMSMKSIDASAMDRVQA